MKLLTAFILPVLIVSAAAAVKPPVEVPFELFSNQIVMQVAIEGNGPLTMLLDTGTDPTVIDFATARRIGLKTGSKGQPILGGGSDSNLGYETKLPVVTLGGLSARNVAAVALDLSRLSGELVRHVDGVLGHSLLNGRTVQIDYAKRLVRFYEPGPLPVMSEPGVLMHFRYDGSILIDDVMVNGRKVTANLDTGSNETFSLTPELTAALQLEEVARNGRPAPSVGYNGVSENRRAQIEALQIGSLKVDSPVVTFFPKKAGHDREKWGLSIGNAFLKDYILTIDYRSHLVMLGK